MSTHTAQFYESFRLNPSLIHTISKEIIIDFMEQHRWKDNVVSPFDITSKVYKCKNHNYRCKNTKKYFNVKTGTILSDTKISLGKWLYILDALANNKRGISSYQLAKNIGITQNTAWYLKQKVRDAMGIDNLYQVTAFPTIQNIVSKVVTNDSILIPDDGLGHTLLSEIYEHYIIEHSHKEYVNHEGLEVVYYKVSRKHLQRYVNEFVFRFTRKDKSEAQRLSDLMDLVFMNKVSYQQIKDGPENMDESNIKAIKKIYDEFLKELSDKKMKDPFP
jgi:transposase-like protein